MKINKDAELRTSDLYLAAWLRANNVPFLRIEGEPGEKKTFVFDAHPNRERALEHFYCQPLLQSFISCVGAMKRAVHVGTEG